MLKVLVAFLLLLSGLVVYWLFRPGLVFFHWLGLHNPHPLVAFGVFQPFFKNHFADIAWCAAVFTIARLLRERNFPPFYASFLLALPFLNELFLAFRLIPGTFDWVDVLIYTVLFLLFFRKEVIQMQPFRQHLAGGIFVAVFISALIGSGPPPPPPRVPPPPPVVYQYENGLFTLEQDKDEVFTKPSMARLFQTAKSRSIVLRVPVSGEKIMEEQVQKSNVLYSTIEKELAKAGFIVRDRALFTKVLEQGNLDYTKIGQLTETEMILELVRFSSKTYFTQKYKDETGTEKSTPEPMSFTGASIEFKLISVKENDLVGAYIFNYTPCTTGCTRRFCLKLRGSADVPVNQEAIVKEFAVRLIAQLENKR